MYLILTQAAEEPVPISFNPFLVDDPTPSLLLDNDSPTNSKAKPIKDVLDFFTKDSFEKPKEIANENSKVKKSIPPPRPPPPKRTTSNEVLEVTNTPDNASNLSNPDNTNPVLLSKDNNFSPDSEGVPVVTQNTAISSQLSGEFYFL